ncbi:hypothetical protein D3C81_2089410 [compost metagenome]
MRKRMDSAGGETLRALAAALNDSQRASVTAMRRSSRLIIQFNLMIDDSALNHGFTMTE